MAALPLDDDSTSSTPRSTPGTLLSASSSSRQLVTKASGGVMRVRDASATTLRLESGTQSSDHQAWVCASCERELSGAALSPCSHCGGVSLLDDRYRIDEVLGQGANGTTYRATRLADARVVAIKELPIRAARSLKALELYDREINVLRQLDHPHIPKYIEHFYTGASRHASLCLVQEFIDGHTLEHELRGHRYTEEEVLQVIGALVEPLGYLHSLQPPLVHRDIKPSNVMRRRSDGALVLIDFGAVTEASLGASGSTIIGTVGYMSPEHFRGKTTAASDVYSLGALAVNLLSRRDPADLLDANNELDWGSWVSVTDETEGLLAKMLAADASERLVDAFAVQELLQHMESEPTGEVHLELARLASEHSESSPSSDAKDASEAAVIKWLGILLVVLGSSVVLFAVFSRRPQPDNKPPPVYSALPDGLLGLRLGQTVEEAKAARGDDLERLTRFGFRLPGQKNDFDQAWERYLVHGRIHGAEAECRAVFAHFERLAELECDFEVNSKESHAIAESLHYRSLSETYGPSAFSTPRYLTVHERVLWQRQSSCCELSLISVEGMYYYSSSRLRQLNRGAPRLSLRLRTHSQREFAEFLERANLEQALGWDSRRLMQQ